MIAGPTTTLTDYLLALQGAWLGSQLLAGVAVSCAGAIVQHGAFSLHPHFNHNDLFHVAQMAGLWFYFDAARAFEDRGRPRCAR